MSTRSRIGIIRPAPAGSDNTTPLVESIYCHFDGYPEGVGQMLLDHWTDEKKINRLMKLGDLSSLGSVIGRKHDFDHHHADYYSEPVREMLERLSEDEAGELRRQLHEESPYGKGWCNFYGRDRGEEGCESRIHGIDDFPDYGQEAEYLFDPATGEWRARQQTFNPVGWNTVTPWEGWITIPEAIELEQKAGMR